MITRKTKTILLCGLLTVMATLAAIGQASATKVVNIQGKTTIPEDASIRKGVLANGMTYYLHSTDVVADKASYYIFQNVGSVLENDEQQGLAHFLEHMAFNGTQTYPGKAFLNTMQEKGLVFGRDINAYTSFDETVYNINNVPTTAEMTNHGLQILHDWANGLLLTDEEIDAERGVIKEEWRQRRNGQMRIFEQMADVFYGGSLYSKRFPIGLMEIVENFEYQLMRDFYHDWYRTDLQAIAVIGDIDVAAMEAKIKEKFETIPAVKNPKERFSVKIPDHTGLKFVMATDKEVGEEKVQLLIRHPKMLNNGSIGALEASMTRQFFKDILKERLTTLSQKPETPFIEASIGTYPWVREHALFALDVKPKPNQQKEAFTLVMNELQRALRFGFTQAEIDRQVANVTSLYENYIKELGDRTHKAISQIMLANYLEHDPMTDPVKEFEALKEILKGLTSEKIRQALQSFFTTKNRSVIVTGIAGNQNLDQAEVEKIITQAENNSTLQPYAEEDNSRTLMDGVRLTGGSIVGTQQNEALGFTEYSLSNGIKVYHKFVNKDENKVSFRALSEGGLSLTDKDDFFNAGATPYLSELSGLNGFSQSELQKKLTGKKVRITASLREYEEVIGGSGSTQDVETMLQLVNLRFTRPQFKQEAYDLAKQRYNAMLFQKKNDIGKKMGDSVTVHVFGEEGAKRILSKKLVASLDLNKAKNTYLERFKNPADFTFFIVGDVTKEALEPLMEKYLASLPTTQEMETFNKEYQMEWISDHIQKEFHMPMETPKATVQFLAKKETPSFSLKDKYLIRILGDILQLRYTETLREDEGGTYGAGVNPTYAEKPTTECMLYVSFSCDPEKADGLLAIAKEEFQKIAEGDIKTEDFEKTIKATLKARNEARLRNGYYASVLSTYVLEGYNMDAKENFEDIINGISKTDVQNMAKALLSKDAQSFEFVFKPKN